jgi:hypothetical protein
MLFFEGWTSYWILPIWPFNCRLIFFEEQWIWDLRFFKVYLKFIRFICPKKRTQAVTLCF